VTTALLVFTVATLEVVAILYLARRMGRQRWPWPGITNFTTPHRTHRRRRS